MKNNLFLNPRITKIFLSLNTNRGYYPKLYVELGCTIWAMSESLKKFEKIGLIKVSKKGRERKVELTRKGKRFANKLVELQNLLK